MLQNARAAAFTVSELLRENQQDGGGVGGVGDYPLSTTQVKLRFY